MVGDLLLRNTGTFKEKWRKDIDGAEPLRKDCMIKMNQVLGVLVGHSSLETLILNFFSLIRSPLGKKLIEKSHQGNKIKWKIRHTYLPIRIINHRTSWQGYSGFSIINLMSRRN